MSKFQRFAGVGMIIAAMLAVGGCGSDSPTESTTAPVISQLQAQSAQRISGDAGLVFISFSYVDPDADIDRVTFSVAGGGTVTNPFDGADQESGVAGVQQAVNLPATGNEVQFSIFVLDRRGNQSNTLSASFVAP